VRSCTHVAKPVKIEKSFATIVKEQTAIFLAEHLAAKVYNVLATTIVVGSVGAFVYYYFGSKITGFYSGVGDVYDDATGGIKRRVGVLKDNVHGAWKSTADALKASKEAITAKAGSVADSIAQNTSSGASQVSDSVRAGFDTVKEATLRGPGAIGSGLSTVKDAAVKSTESLAGGVVSAKDAVIGTVTSAGNLISAGVSSAKESVTGTSKPSAPTSSDDKSEKSEVKGLNIADIASDHAGSALTGMKEKVVGAIWPRKKED
jgi:phage-related protein